MTLTDTSFVPDMGLLLAALTELQDLFLKLQKRSKWLMGAHKLLEM
jgi:hypothetical protein